MAICKVTLQENLVRQKLQAEASLEYYSEDGKTPYALKMISELKEELKAIEEQILANKHLKNEELEN